jgi:hypothetical protein
MSAFNQRLEPQYIANTLPVLSAMALLMLLVSALLTLLLPFLLLQVVFGLTAIVSFALVIAGFVLGRDLPFVWIKLDGNRDANAQSNLTSDRY